MRKTKVHHMRRDTPQFGDLFFTDNTPQLAYILVCLGNDKYILVNLSNGDRWNEPCSKDDLFDGTLWKRFSGQVILEQN